MDFYRLLSTITELRPSWGTLLIVIFVLIALASTFKQGRGGVLRNILGIYMAIAVSNFLPFLNLEIKGFRVDSHPSIKIALFIVIFVIITFILSHSSLATLDRSRSTFLVTFTLSLLNAGLLVSTVAVMLPPEIKKELT